MWLVVVKVNWKQTCGSVPVSAGLAYHACIQSERVPALCMTASWKRLAVKTAAMCCPGLECYRTGGRQSRKASGWEGQRVLLGLCRVKGMCKEVCRPFSGLGISTDLGSRLKWGLSVPVLCV